jgi:hypothetical protein
MSMMIAFCGLNCISCPIHLASIEPDEQIRNAMKEKIAEQCSIYYGLKLLPEDVTDCYGCRADSGKLFSGCKNCEIRKCAGQKNIENCAFCEDYACEILEKHFLLDPSSKERLEKIRSFQ